MRTIIYTVFGIKHYIKYVINFLDNCHEVACMHCVTENLRLCQMNSMITRYKSRNFLVVILFMQCIVYVTVFLDVPVARQIVGFLYFTFIPGFVSIKLLKFDRLDKLGTILFSVGLSIALLMLVGLFLNEFGLLFGLSAPLSLVPLMVVLNSIILVGAIVVCVRDDGINHWEVKSFRIPVLTLILTVLPILSVAGVMYVNIFGNNLILLFLIIVISLLFIIGCVSKKLLPSKLYSLVLLIIAISLLFHSSLVSNYLVTFGSDVPLEYFAARTTENNALWNSTNPHFGDDIYGRINTMLSVTILPTIYSSLLNIDLQWVFKILFPLIFSFVPLCLYQVWQKIFGRKYAFISTFLFMAQSTFYTELLGLNRQMIAELFFALLILCISIKETKPTKRLLLFVIFSFALVVSHYALAEIFLFFITATFILLIVLKRPGRNLTVSMILLFFVIMFSWYIYTSDSATFDSFLSFGSYISSQLGEFLNPASRGQTVLRGLGMESPPSILNAIGRVFAYLTQVIIAVGFVGLITKRIRFSLEREYFTLSVMAMAFLAAVILVPGLANSFNMTRFYHVLLFLLAPFCAIGMVFIAQHIFKLKNEFHVSILLVIVLVPYFLFQVGFIYEVAGSDSWSIPLSKYRMNPFRLYGSSGYADTQSVFGAEWLSRTVDVKGPTVYSDGTSRNQILTSYGMVYRNFVNEISNVTTVIGGGTVYLGRLIVVEGTIISRGISWNFSELSLFDYLDKVYANGGCEIYFNAQDA